MLRLDIWLFVFCSYPVNEHKLGDSRTGVQHFTEGVHDFTAVQFLHHFFKPTIYGTFTGKQTSNSQALLTADSLNRTKRMTSLCWHSYLILKHSLTSLFCNPNVITVSFVCEQHPIINKYGSFVCRILLKMSEDNH